MRVNVLQILTMHFHLRSMLYIYFSATALSLLFVGSLIYTSIYLFDLGQDDLSFSGYFGVLLLATAVAFLLSIDKGKAIPLSVYKGGIKSILRYLIMSRGASLAGISIVILAFAFAFASLFNQQIEVKISTEKGIVVGSKRNPTHFFTINPFQSWQNTGILLTKGDEIKVTVTGAVSPGYAQNIKSINECVQYMINCDKKYNKDTKELHECKAKKGSSPNIPWPYTQPGGYKMDFYTEYTKRPEMREFFGELPKFTDDDGLTVKGKPHNSVIGAVASEGKSLDGVKYDWSVDGSDLFDFSHSNENTFEVPIEGYLWVVINDEEAFRHDNGGLYYLR